MKWWMEVTQDAPAPKRGDILQSNLNDRRERTWIVLHAARMKRATNRRYMLWRARWWEIEPDMRMRLYKSAERRGGQVVWFCFPLKKEKRDFESQLRQGIKRVQRNG